MSQCYKLTPAECRLALLLAQGKALCRVAGQLGVSVSTVKSQARAIYLKTGVVRQTELICLLTQLPAAAVQSQTLRPWSDPSARSDAVRQTLSPPRSRRGLGTERTARAAGQPSARV